MSLHDMMRADLRGVFINLDEFAELCDVTYDGETYTDVPMQISGKKERDRKPKAGDHAQKLYKSAYTIHCAASDLGNNLPEQGVQFELTRRDEHGERLMPELFFVGASSIQEGMLRIELEVTDE